MKFFKNLKIGQKLIFSFLLVAILIGAVGYVGIINMQKINSNVKNMYELDLKGVEHINKIKSNLLTIRADILLILDEANHSDIDKLHNEISEMVKQNEELLENYNKTITTAENRAYFDEFLKLLKEYRIERDKLIQLARNNDYVGARSLLPDVTKIRGYLRYLYFSIKSICKLIITSSSCIFIYINLRKDVKSWKTC